VKVAERVLNLEVSPANSIATGIARNECHSALQEGKAATPGVGVPSPTKKGNYPAGPGRPSYPSSKLVAPAFGPRAPASVLLPEMPLPMQRVVDPGTARRATRDEQKVLAFVANKNVGLISASVAK